MRKYEIAAKQAKTLVNIGYAPASGILRKPPKNFPRNTLNKTPFIYATLTRSYGHIKPLLNFRIKPRKVFDRIRAIRIGNSNDLIACATNTPLQRKTIPTIGGIAHYDRSGLLGKSARTIA